MAKPPTGKQHVERPGPADFRDPLIHRELQRAGVWFGMALLIVGVIVLAQPLLLIVGGMILAVMLDGGARLLGRVLPVGRGWRLLLVILLAFGFVGWTLWYAGTTFVAQFEALRVVVDAQLTRVVAWAAKVGLVPHGSTFGSLGSQMLGSVGKLTSAVGSAIGAVGSMILIVVIGIFIAMEPQLYDRGVAWLLPMRHRERFYRIGDDIGWTLRRLLAGRLFGMLFEGIFTWLMLAYVGRIFGIPPVPMAALLGLITGLLAFLPNIGAITSGVLMVAVGFSAGPEQGLWAIFVYFFVQNIDGYLVIPYIARRTVDLAPAVVLATQLLLGTLFGILGVLFADPILAALKVFLIDLSKSRPAVASAEGAASAAAAAASSGPRSERPARRGRRTRG